MQRSGQVVFGLGIVLLISGLLAYYGVICEVQIEALACTLLVWVGLFILAPFFLAVGAYYMLLPKLKSGFTELKSEFKSTQKSVPGWLRLGSKTNFYLFTIILIVILALLGATPRPIVALVLWILVAFFAAVAGGIVGISTVLSLTYRKVKARSWLRSKRLP